MTREAALAMRRSIFIDEETGECFDINDDHLHVSNNVETGEPETNVDFRRIRRKVPFQIPKDIQKSISKKKYDKFKDIDSIPDGETFCRINPVCLFLPAIIYFRWFVAVLFLMEVILHVYSHRKNKSLKDSNVYYQSPFHGISSEFCALCQSETCMNRVDKMQQARMHRFLKQCNYMKRVVT
ncbi:uncharacterized protein LOC122502489 [Leptopilina heterotoma]|uniref:uncharacterized protein LOC122502489 n=1 Tax=Leptopilina heterotoma TaxID=63436 RepID=UPI001CA8539A|nr:uncharacterized protein LOC122502489 [Leptopilina heterotoma]XP_043468512.1 uncharacterized protein LOC122502489 [Leptopilina heterotoma]